MSAAIALISADQKLNQYHLFQVISYSEFIRKLMKDHNNSKRDLSETNLEEIRSVLVKQEVSGGVICDRDSPAGSERS